MEKRILIMHKSKTSEGYDTFHKPRGLTINLHL